MNAPNDPIVDPPEDGIDAAVAANGENPFWDFSVRVYSGVGVVEACLTLQDTRGADVNIALLCCFLGFSGVRINREAIEKTDQLVAGWRAEAIDPLRRVRRALKHAVGPVLASESQRLRSHVKRAELDAERIEQDVLFRALDGLAGKNAREAERSGVARMNLLEYARFLGVPAEEIKDAVEPLIHAVRAALDASDEDADAGTD